MREYIEDNLKEIMKHVKKRKKILSNLNELSMVQEFKEWNNNDMKKKELIWTLPDLTSDERLKNFCRSIKKELK